VYFLPGKLSENEMDQEFLQKSIDYIIKNISDEKLNVEGLAEVLKINRSNVYRKIKALTGNSVVEFISNIRLKQAIKLMETNKFSLAEIAYQTGFSSPSYFTKMFKRKYGKTPSEFINSK
jgi:AraC-like DNA-binding protein